jgi:predicted NodU family carbamoyl transferase
MCEEFPAFVEERTFVKHWQELTQGLLDGLLGPNVCVAGGSVLNCLLNRSLAWETAGKHARTH